ncbi:MAG: amino acid permease [bacterium]|nr:amino acid permease [bacterium]
MKSTNEDPGGSKGLRRQLGLFDSTMITAGIVIGSGIFLTTGIMATHVPSAVLIIAAWVVGGLITLAGALTYAELGAAFPEAGGQYVYLREAYGPLAGFLFGWQHFFVYMSGGIAGLGVVFADIAGSLIPALAADRVVASSSVAGFDLRVQTGQLVAIGVILVLTALNYIGVRVGSSIQNVLTVIKIATLVAFGVLGLIYGRGLEIGLGSTGVEAGDHSVVAGFGLALIAVFWAFDGWNNVTFVSGEIMNPGRTLPRALIMGTVLITILYVLANLFYVVALPMSDLVGELQVAEQAAQALFGTTAAKLVAIAVTLSVLGALNGSILSGPRVAFAMARDGLFFKRLGRVHPRFETPGLAILAMGLWSAVLALSGTFETIITFTIFVSVVFWIAAAAAVFTLRRTRPDLPRPYRTWGYPIVPALFVLASVGILINTLLEQPREALAGLGVTLVGLPCYLVWRKRNQKRHVE